MSWRDIVAVVGGFGAGFLSGTIGIGGGLLFVPTMTLGFSASQAIAQGTSLVAIVPTAIVGGVACLTPGDRRELTGSMSRSRNCANICVSGSFQARNAACERKRAASSRPNGAYGSSGLDS